MAFWGSNIILTELVPEYFSIYPYV